jgi:hypothetical protein
VYFIEEEEEEEAREPFRWLCLTGQNEPWYWSPNREAAANEEEDRRSIIQGDGKLADLAQLILSSSCNNNTGVSSLSLPCHHHRPESNHY